MACPTRFSVYNHKLVTNDNQLITQQLIVLILDDGTLRFTNFHKYAKNLKSRIRKVTQNSNDRCYYITQFLNYIFFYKMIECLTKVSVNIIKEFLNDYGKCELPEDDETTHRGKQSVNKCVSTIMDFMELLIHENKNNCYIKDDDLYRFVDFRDKNGRVIQRKVPVFDVIYTGNNLQIFRDMPNKVFEIIFDHIAVNHTKLLALIILSAFAGLRPSECCNVRRPDSPLGPGIIFTSINGEITKVQIDLRKEYQLRSDLVSTGNIKKERLQIVPDIFLKAFMDSYNIYMTYIEGKPYEKEFGPLTINMQGKAYTYASYYGQFQEIIREEIIPKLLADQDPTVVLYGRMLLEHKLSPHIFRHWYTVQLVLSGVNEPGVLMALRGDSSPESALTYIKNKSELQKMFSTVNNENFEYLSWIAKKRHENNV